MFPQIFLIPLLLLSACANTPKGPAKSGSIEGAGAPPPTRTADITLIKVPVEIAATPERVWEVMLSPEGYAAWTSGFFPGSYFEGSWEAGERILFLAPGGSGMVAEIAENRPHEFLSVRHLGYTINGQEDLTSPRVTAWAPAYENFRLTPTAVGTKLVIEHEVFTNMTESMRSSWVKSLELLKELCEQPGS